MDSGDQIAKLTSEMGSPPSITHIKWYYTTLASVNQKLNIYRNHAGWRPSWILKIGQVALFGNHANKFGSYAIYALPCLGYLARRGAIGARHDGLPHQFSPLLPVVCHGWSLCEGFAGPLSDVGQSSSFSVCPFLDCFRIFPVVSLLLGRPIMSRAHTITFSPLYSCQIFLRSCMLYNGFTAHTSLCLCRICQVSFEASKR